MNAAGRSAYRFEQKELNALLTQHGTRLVLPEERSALDGDQPLVSSFVAVSNQPMPIGNAEVGIFVCRR